MLSQKHNFLFIHIPKNGGSSMRQWMYDIFQDPLLKIWNHTKISDVQKAILPEYFNPMFKFALVRNTWDRLVSSYFFIKKNTPLSYNNPYRHNLAQKLPFKKFTMQEPQTNQLTWITDKKGKVIVDFIGRYENISEDANVIATKLGIKNPPPFPWINKTSHRHYSTYYDEELVEFVRNHYKEEINMFNYKFNNAKSSTSFLYL